MAPSREQRVGCACAQKRNRSVPEPLASCIRAMARFRRSAYAAIVRSVATNPEKHMRRRKLVTLATERDIEAACEWMDRRERNTLQDVRDQIDDGDERALVLQARDGVSHHSW